MTDPPSRTISSDDALGAYPRAKPARDEPAGYVALALLEQEIAMRPLWPDAVTQRQRVAGTASRAGKFVCHRGVTYAG